MAQRVKRKIASDSPDKHSPGSAKKQHKFTFDKNDTQHSAKIRTQAQNMDKNTPGANTRLNGEREMYTNFKVSVGINRFEDTDLV